MKKFFYILAAAAMAVTAASCQKEVIPASDGPEVSATFSVALPGNFTKAISDGQTVDQLVFGVYSGGEEIAALRQNDVAVTAGKATVTVQLVKGQTYTFAFWAQKKGTGYYNTTDLAAVTVHYTGNANDETRDAFYACKADYTVAGPFTETVVLKRPFAQINVGTSDAAAAAAAGIVVEKSEMTIAGAGNTLNLLTGAVSGSETVTYTVEAIPTETLKVKSGDAAIDAIDYQWLAMNYILVGKAEKSLVDVTATLTFANGKGTLPLEIPNAPVQGNYRTNIIGALLTSQGTFNIIVDEEYDDNSDYVVSPVASVGNKIYNTLQEAVAAATNGETVSLLDNVVVDAAINVASGVNAVLDLNGKSITANGANIQAINVNGGTLTIKGEGTVNGGKGGNNAAVFVTNGGTVTINGGNYTVGPDASNAGNPCIETKGGNVVINGGYFRTDAAWNNFYYVLNQNNSTPGTIQVKGGKFENFNPANGDDHLGGSFVADGYACVKVGEAPDVYEVQPPTGCAAVVNAVKYDTVADAVAAVNALGTEAAVMTLAEDWTWETGNAGDGSNTLFGNEGQTVTIKANGKKIVAAGDGGIRCNAEVVVEDAIVVDNTAYEYENGETAFEFTYLEFQGAGSFKFIGCTFENTVMADAAMVEFDDCAFIGKATLESNAANEYALWIAGPAVVKNCEFANIYRGIKIAQKYGTEPNPLYTVEIDGCTFKNIEKKPGVVIDAVTYAGATMFGRVTIKNSYFENVKAGDQGLYIYETDNLTPVLENNTLVLADGVNLVDADYQITAAAGLQWLSEQVAAGTTFAGKKVLLASDIDMAGVDFKPIGNVSGYPSKTFAGTFDGKGKTISNLTASSNEAKYAAAGLFGSITGKVENVNLTNVNISSTHYAGGVVAYISANTGASVENCTVNGGTITSTAELIDGSYDNGDKAGGIVGYITADDFVKGCSVSNITVKAYRDLGAIVGCTSGAVNVTNCTIGENVCVKVDNTHNYKNYSDLDSHNAGHFVGRDDSKNANISNCTGTATISML